jgi:spore coat polysaccharide biosynthesis predicted glycosyltransferase SpsG
LKNILITFGGSDMGSVIIQALEDLEKIDDYHNLSIVVILGPISTHYKEIKKKAANSRHAVTIKKNVSNMGEYLIWADLCIGAVGSSIWERCCLGCPSIVTVLAQNQRDGAHKLEAAGVLLTYSSKNSGDLVDKIKHMDCNMRKKLSINGINLVDGMGTVRVLNKLFELS